MHILYTVHEQYTKNSIVRILINIVANAVPVLVQYIL